MMMTRMMIYFQSAKRMKTTYNDNESNDTIQLGLLLQHLALEGLGIGLEQLDEIRSGRDIHIHQQYQREPQTCRQ